MKEKMRGRLTNEGADYSRHWLLPLGVAPMGGLLISHWFWKVCSNGDPHSTDSYH